MRLLFNILYLRRVAKLDALSHPHLSTCCSLHCVHGTANSDAESVPGLMMIVLIHSDNPLRLWTPSDECSPTTQRQKERNACKNAISILKFSASCSPALVDTHTACCIPFTLVKPPNPLILKSRLLLEGIFLG